MTRPLTPKGNDGRALVIGGCRVLPVSVRRETFARYDSWDEPPE